MPFTFKKLAIPEVILIEPQIFADDRGYFAEIYKEHDFKQNGIQLDFVQDNHAQSQAGVLRGLHFQLDDKPQGKLVRVIQGAIFDVAVDLRKGSPTYKHWVSAVLNSENHHMLWVPPGFAHGVYALEDNTHVAYKVTDYYSKEYDRSIRWDDPEIGIVWPTNKPNLSAKDASAPFLKNSDSNFTYI